MLDGLTIRVAGTCSGCESSIPVLEHTLASLHARYGVNVQAEHVLSCDSDASRLQAHGKKLGMLVGTVEAQKPYMVLSLRLKI